MVTEFVREGLLYSMRRVLGDTVVLAGKRTRIDPAMKMTGGFANPAILELKRRIFSGFTFEMRDDCPILHKIQKKIKKG